ncbi:MAG: hypothetical protein QOD77_1255 [Thermoplasmata archaeon]|jgi:hypothetical protein|nr:hypothetical protein [Thermoplasmata archaeon]
MTSERRAALLVLLVLPLLAGCLATGPSAPPPFPKTGEVPVPVWVPGQSWSYLLDDGSWSNWTVEAAEARRGFEAYRVRFDNSRPEPAYGGRREVAWFDAATLGRIEDQGVLRSWSDCPQGQVFPLVNRSYTCTLTSSNGYTQAIPSNSTVGGWSLVATPAGAFAAVETWVRTPNGATLQHAWYSPQAGNHVRRVNYAGEAQVLAAWSVPDAAT